MTLRSFVIQLAGLSATVALLLSLLHLWPPIAENQSFSWICWSAFIFFSIIMFFMGKLSAADQGKDIFVSMSILLSGAKMLLSVLLVILYSRWAHPTNQSFVIPFFLVYLSFTIFETHFMMKLAQEKKIPQ